MNKNVRSLNKSKKTYSSKFLKRNTMKSRGGKSIYVRAEYHRKLDYMLKIIGNGEIPLYAYLDNILNEHFELHSQEILEEYNKNNTLIFKSI